MLNYDNNRLRGYTYLKSFEQSDMHYLSTRNAWVHLILESL